MSIAYRSLDVGGIRSLFFRKKRAAKELTALINWPDRLRGKFPIAVEAHEKHGEVYWNFRLGCFAGIVSGGKDSWPDYRREALIAILEALNIVDKERPASPETSVSALITWPHMHGSEICVHFTKEHEQGFTPEAYNSSRNEEFFEYEGVRTKATTPSENPFKILNVDVPNDIDIGGYHMHIIDEDGEETHSDHWSVMRKNQRLSDKTYSAKAI